MFETFHDISKCTQQCISGVSNRAMPISVSLVDIVDFDPELICDAIPEELICRYWESIEQRTCPQTLTCCPNSTKNALLNGTTRVPPCFNSRGYDLGLIHKYFVTNISQGDDLAVAVK